MRTTPRSDRLHIAIFGKRNAGKSSLINALTSQPVALVSDVPGTTTDPVYKAMELLPVGPVVFIDTAGIDDAGDLGRLRVKRSLSVSNMADMALLVVDSLTGPSPIEQNLARRLAAKDLPVVGVLNKSDLVSPDEAQVLLERCRADIGVNFVAVSALTGSGIGALKEAIIKKAPGDWEGPPILGDLVKPGDLVVLVVPIDLEAPKGRIILPQVQAIRDVLDSDCYCIMVKENRLKEALERMKTSPRLVITDSQAFDKVASQVPVGVGLTSFSILFARHKGDLKTLVSGARRIESLKPGDSVLIAEACTHHPIGDDIGRVKIPRWLDKKVGGPLKFTWYAGGGFPEDLSGFKLAIHCGGCMINRREMLARLCALREAGVPVVNYGVLISYLHGIMDRALAPLERTEGGSSHRGTEGVI